MAICECIPSANIACQNQESISVAQSQCQILPDNTTMENPFYDSTLNITYWSYKLVIGCPQSPIVEPTIIYIPIYENISTEMLSVSEFILSCGRFEEVSFDFDTTITPPAGFKYVRIPVNDRYTTGTSATYRLAVLGNYPQAIQSILVQTNGADLLTFDADYQVPGEPANARLSVTKTAEVSIVDNQATINYTATVTNTGNVNLADVSYLDTINYDNENVSIGTITVDPSTINVDTSTPGTIVLSGDLGNLNMGESAVITYSVPLTGYNRPGNFVFASSTTARSGDVTNTTNTEINVEVVQFSTNAVCNVSSSNTGEFIIGISSVPSSPDSNIFITDTITVPTGVTVQFISFGSCTAVFADTGEPVLLNTDVTDRQIVITCTANIPPSGTMNYTFSLRAISTTTIQQTPGEIVNIITDVTLQDPSMQVLLGVSPLPNTVSMEAGGEAVCSNVCNVLE